MSGLEWDKNIGKAKLSTGKVTELRNLLLDEIIPRLDQRREWTRCVHAYNPTLAGVLKPELQTEHAFEQFQRVFVLIFDAKKDVWRLCFVRDLRKKQPPHDDAGNVAGESTGVAAAAAPNLRDIAERIAERAAWRLGYEAERLVQRTPWLAALVARPHRASLSELMRDAYVRTQAASGARLERRRVAVGRDTMEVSSFIWSGFPFGKTLEQELLCFE